jgi:orotate phosphoribosyltransferase
MTGSGARSGSVLDTGLPAGGTTDWDRDAALTTARLLLEIKAVNFRPEEPYTLTSGWKSPVYIDCRRIIFFPRARAKIVELGVEKIGRHVGYESIDVVAGGETAGIPFAAWIADRMLAPMAYVRKKPKGFGRNALIEGDVPEGRRTLLVEDLTTDGASKVRFANSLREAGAIVNHAFVVFFYGVFPGAHRTLADMDIQLHALCTWWDVLEACAERPYFSDTAASEVRRFLEDPCAWSAKHGGVASAEEALARKAAKDAEG